MKTVIMARPINLNLTKEEAANNKCGMVLQLRTGANLVPDGLVDHPFIKANLASAQPAIDVDAVRLAEARALVARADAEEAAKKGVAAEVAPVPTPEIEAGDKAPSKGKK